jgi:hypothetical protein
MYNFHPINKAQIGNLLNSWGIKHHIVMEEDGNVIIVVPKFRYLHIDALIGELQERVPVSCIVKLRRDANWFWL